MEKQITTWAKTTPDGQPGISVLDHCRNVGWVGLLMAEYKSIPSLDESLEPLEIAGVVATHDVGKTSKVFSCKCVTWLEQQGLFEKSRSERWPISNLFHGQISQYSLYQALREAGISKPFCKDLPLIAGSHHGRIYKTPDGRDMDDWEPFRNELIKQLWDEFAAPRNLCLSKSSPFFPVLMGLTTVADWIGSDATFFPSDKGLSKDECLEKAGEALKTIGFKPPKITRDLTFNDLFSFDPNELQQKAVETITEPGLYIIEAPMGLGKTEAVLSCAYHLLSQGKATGLYFALPTQTTSNRIHLRVHEFIERISPDSPETQLIHGASWLHRKTYHPDIKDEGDYNEKYQGISWFASSKRALLSPFGVGTVDQALLGIVPVKHWFVRRFALAGKVVIIDEVHSYDMYTGTLIKALCDELVAIGCTVILLSATLLPNLRNRFLNCSDDVQVNDYPLITGKPFQNPSCITPVPARSDSKPPVRVLFKPSDSIMDDAVNLALKGTRILWVCNTVNQAQTVYTQLGKLFQGKPFDIGLLHSRFPFFKRDQLEDAWLERFGHGATNPNGCILVSTQIVEQSVDIDADLLISELAPMDMLLQRIGRLWRHLLKRPPASRPVDEAQIWVIEEPCGFPFFLDASAEHIIKELGPKGRVYFPYVLLRTLKTLKESVESIQLPNDIRSLLKETYKPLDEEPEAWLSLYEEAYGEEKAKERVAEYNSRIWNKIELEDVEGRSTRFITLETRSLVLIREMTIDRIVLLNGETVPSVFSRFSINDARAIHRNIVKVHDWPFSGQPEISPFENYVKETHQSALILEDGSLKIDGLKEGFTYHWHEELGVYLGSQKGENDESYD